METKTTTESNSGLPENKIENNENQSTIEKLKKELEASRKKNEFDRITISDLKKEQKSVEVNKPAQVSNDSTNLILEKMNSMEKEIKSLHQQDSKNQLLNSLGISAERFNEINSIYKEKEKVDLNEIKNPNTAKLLISGFLSQSGKDINVSNSPQQLSFKQETARRQSEIEKVRKSLRGKNKEAGNLVMDAPFKQYIPPIAKKR